MTHESCHLGNTGRYLWYAFVVTVVGTITGIQKLMKSLGYHHSIREL